MRITVDPTLTVPGHALNKWQIRRVLSVVPTEWREPIKSVRISNTLHSGPSAQYSFVSHRLTVYSRGRAEHDVIRDILMELLLHYTMTHPTPLSRLAESQRKRLNREVEPLLEKALHAIEDAEQNRPPEPPLPVSVSSAMVHQTLDSLPGPGSGGGR